MNQRRVIRGNPYQSPILQEKKKNERTPNLVETIISRGHTVERGQSRSGGEATKLTLSWRGDGVLEGKGRITHVTGVEDKRGRLVFGGGLG